MKTPKIFVAATIILGICVATFGSAAARPSPGTTVFVGNYDHVTAYPIGSQGNVAPLALTIDMVFPSGIARDGNGRIYITNPDTNTVAVYPHDATGNVWPMKVISGSKTRLANPTGIALDQHGNIYVLNRATAAITVYASTDNIGVLGTGPALFNQAPMAVITGSKTKLKAPVGIAVDGSGNIYVANELGGPVLKNQGFTFGAITVYPAGSKGNVAPSAIITGTATGLMSPGSIAVASNDDIYVANGFTNVDGSFIYQPNISVYPAGSDGDVQPAKVITGGDTGLNSASAIALDGAHNIYAAGYSTAGKNLIEVFPSGSSGNVSPDVTVVGADTRLSFVTGITLDRAGNLYALNSGVGSIGHGSITVYLSGSSGNAAPINTISSSFTGINSSSGIAMDSKGRIYVTNGPGGPDFQGGSLSIFAPGSYATAAPASVIMGDNTGLNYPQKVALDGKGNVSVLNSDNVVTVYPAGSAGNVTPSATINIRSGNLGPTGIARGIGGELYVVSQGSLSCNDNGQDCRQTSLGAIDVYPAHATGNAKPSAVVTGHDTNLASPSAIAVSGRGNIFVANQGPQDCSFWGCFPNGPGSITVYAPGTEGNAKPIATIQGPHTRLGFPTGIAVDASENIYVVANGGFGGAYVNGGRGAKRNDICFGCEHATIPGRARGNLAGVAPDIYLVPGVFDIGTFGVGNSILLIFKAGSDGDTPPIATIYGSFTALDGSAIAIGPSGP